MIAPSPVTDRRTRPDGSAPRGVLPPSCATHHGFPAGRCPLCAAEAAPKERGHAGAAKRDAAIVDAAKVLRELDARPTPKAKAKPRAVSPSTPPVEKKLPPPPKVPREARRAAMTAKPARLPRPPAPPRPVKLRLPLPPKPLRALQAVDLDGVRIPIVTAARERSLRTGTVRNRLDRGWTVREALGVDAPPAQRDGKGTNAPRLLTWNGKTQSMSAWAKEIGIDHSTMRYRVERGMRGAELFAPRNASRGPQGTTVRALVTAALAAIHGPPTRAGGRRA